MLTFSNKISNENGDAKQRHIYLDQFVLLITAFPP
jgi:hypothetical protein